MAKQLNSYEVKLDFKADTSQAKRELQDLQQNLNEAISKAGMANVGQGLSKQLSGAIAAASQLKIQLQEAFNVDTGRLDLGKFKQSMDQSGMSLKKYQEQLSMLGPEGEQAFRQLASSVVQAEVPLKRSNALLTEFATTLKNTARWQISSSLLHGFMGTIQRAYGYAQDLNESLNNIRIVTGYSTDKMAEFAANANKAAQALSTTTTAYTDAALIYYQQGLGDEEVLGRTDVTVKMANVSRQSAEEVSDQLTAIWNNFYDGSKSLEYYADVITALGAATASSSEEISTGLEKFAAVANTVGLSYEYATAALATITATTRQSADTVGTGLRTLFARLEGLKLGDTLEDGVDLNKYSQALDTVGVKLFDVNGEIKDMDTILDETAAKWDTLSKAQQIAFAQTVGGVRQYTNLIALMDNWDFMQSNLGVAGDATGTLEEQAQIYAESWEAAQKRVRAAAEDIYNALLDDKFFISLNDALADVLKNIKVFIDGIGGVRGVILSFGAIFTTIFQKDIANSIDNTIYRFKTLTKAGKAAIEQEKQRANQLLTSSYEGKTDVVSKNMLPAAQEQVKLQDTYLKYADKMTEAQRRQASAMMDQQQILIRNIQLKAEELEQTEKETRALERRATNQIEAEYKKKTGSSISDDVNSLFSTARTAGKVDAGINAIDSILSNNSLEGEQAAETIELLRKKMLDLNLTAEDFNKVFGVNGQKAFQDFSAALKSGDAEEINRLSQSLFGLQGVETGLSTSLESLRGKLKATFGEDSEQYINFSNIIDQVIAKERDLGAASVNLGNQQDQLASYTKKVGQAFKELATNNTTASQSVASLASTILSLGSTLRMITGLVHTLKDDSLSVGEKIGQVITTLTMITLTLTRVEWDKVAAHAANVGALLLEKLGLEENVVATFKKVAADESEAVAIKGVTAALSKHIVVLGLYAAAIGALIFIIYKVIQAMDLENNKLKNAQKTTADLKNNYDNLKNSAEEFHNAIEDYEKGVKSLEDLKDNQEEYNKALEESNQKARELIEKYELFGQYHWENGVIKFDTDNFEHVLEQQANASHRAYLNAGLYQNKVQQDTNKENRNLQLLDAGLILSGNNIDDLFESYINRVNSGTTNLQEALKQALIEMGVEFRGNLDDIIKAFNEYDTANKKIVDSQQYYTEQYVEAKLKESEANQKFLDIADGNINKYNSIVAASAKLNNQEIDLSQIKDVTQVVSQFGLNDFLNKHKGEEAVSNIIGHNYTGPLSGQEIARIYGQKILGHDNFNVSLDNGKASFKNLSGEDILSETDMSIMAQTIAREIAVAVATEMSGIDPEILTGLLEKTDQLDLGFDVSQFLLDSINNGGVDLTTIFAELTQAEADALDVDSIIDVLRNYPNKDLVNKLLEAWGYNPNDWNKLSEDLNKQKDQYDPEANKESLNATGEKAAKDAGIDVEAYKVYRNEIERTEESLHGQWEAVNEVALANMKLAKGLKTIAGNWEDYNEILTDDNANLQDVAQVLGELKEPLAEILNMDMTELALLPDNFAKENWDLITKSIDGVDGALDDLRDKAGEAILVKVSAEFDADGDGQLDQMYQEIHDKIASYNDANFEVGYHLNRESEAEVFQSFEDIINAAGGMSDSLKAYFASMGYDVEVEEVESPVQETKQHFEYPKLDMRATRMAGVPIADGKEVMEWTNTSGGGKAFAVKSITTNGNYGGSATVKKAAAGGGGSRGSKSGGGGGGKSSPAENKPFTSKDDAGIQRYKEIDDALKDLAEDQARLNKLADSYYGANKLKAMKQQLKLLKEEIDLDKERVEWAREYQKEDYDNLKAFADEHGIQLDFDTDYDYLGKERTGSLINYTTIMNNLFEKLHKEEEYANSKTNFSTKEAQDEYYKAHVQPILDVIKEFQTLVGAYDDSTENLDEYSTKALENSVEFQEQTYGVWQKTWELQEEMLESQVKYFDHAKKMLGDSAVEVGEALALMGSWNAGEGYLGADRDFLKIQADSWADLQSQKEEMGDYFYTAAEELEDKFLEGIENWKAHDTEMMEAYGKVADKIVSEIEKNTKWIETLNTTLSSYQKVMKLTGRETDYAAMKRIYQGQMTIADENLKNDTAEADFWSKESATYKKLMDDARKKGNEKEAELYETAWRRAETEAKEANNRILEDLAEKAELATNIMNTSRDEIMAAYEDAVTNGMGFDYLDQVLEHQSEIQDLYLTKTNQVFETTKMLRKIQSDMDATNNRAAKERLNNFSKEIEKLKDKEEMTKADLELAQKRYDLLLAEIALEEAQKAKTTVRLQRDNEGNYGYVYTADQGDIAKAEEDYFKAENDLYNTKLRIANESGQAIYQILSDWQKEYAALEEEYQNNRNMTWEEFCEKKEFLEKTYLKKLETHSYNYRLAQENDARVVTDAWVNNDKGSLPTVTKAVETFESASITCMQNTEKELGTYKDTIEDVIQKQEERFGDANEATRSVEKEVKNLSKEIREDLREEYRKLMISVQNSITKYGQERDAIYNKLIPAYEAMAAEIREVIKARNELADVPDIPEQEYTGRPTDAKVGDVPPTTGGNGGGSGGGGGSGDGGGSGGGGGGSNGGGDSSTGKLPKRSDYATELEYLSALTAVQRKSLGQVARYNELKDLKAQYDILSKMSVPLRAAEGKAQLYQKLKTYHSQGWFDTGGYTGEWNDGSGKLAILHSKELVLNAKDTENMLAVVDIVRQVVNSIDMNAASLAGGYGALSSGGSGATGPQTLEQNVQITASFPNATDHNEIEEAFNNLINKASQYANRR